VSPDVRGGPASAEGGRYDALKVLLSKATAPGTNLAIISHGNPYQAVVGPPYLAEGEAAVIEPLGAQGFRVVGRIRRDAWDALGS
jgi:hypothetical protein